MLSKYGRINFSSIRNTFAHTRTYLLQETNTNKMEILLKVNGNKGKFYVNQNSKTLAEMTFVWAGDDKIIIDHTEV